MLAAAETRGNESIVDGEHQVDAFLGAVARLEEIADARTLVDCLVAPGTS